MSRIHAPPVPPVFEGSYRYDRAPETNIHRIQGSYSSQPPLSERNYEVREPSRQQLRTPPMAEENLRRPFEPSHSLPRPSQEYPTRPDLDRSAQRESLPPLSSIFAGHREAAPRPTFQDRSMSYSTSHQDPRTSTSVAHDHQSWDASYPRPTSSQYSHDSMAAQSPRTEQIPRPQMLPSRAPSSISFPNAQYSPQQQNRPTPSIPWSPRHESAVFRNDYFPRGHDGYKHIPDSQHTLPLPNYRRESDARAVYQTTAPPTPSYPATPASNASVEQVTTKDALGPKIWTGTQFLPRFVRQAEVPGEGLCYFYDDGTHCKTHIDGEAVNAHWGVTKAGKPRKRLAIACITCREKKIKCDPDFPRCVQCEKFGRICKFKNAPRGGHGSPESPPAEAEEASQRPQSQRSEGSFKHASSTPGTSPRIISHSSPEQEPAAAKRQRTGEQEYSPVDSDYYKARYSTSSTERSWAAPIAVTKTRELITLKWPNNPFDADPALVTELANVYFSNIASTTYSFIAEEPFMAWLSSPVTKSADEILLIYALCAVASIFSTRPNSEQIGIELAKTAKFAHNGKFGLQVVQARLLFAIYFENVGDFDKSWDSLGGAIRAATGIKLQLELPFTTNDQEVYPMGMSKGSYAETRRRTFWSCYIMDRLGSFRDGRLSSISTDDIFLRMPCDNLAYTQQKDIQNPFFSIDLDLSYNRHGTFGVMAYLVSICTIYGEIMAASYRAEHGIKARSAATFVEDINARLDRWFVSVPPCITSNKDNVRKTTDFGLLGTFSAIHAVYRTAQIKLNTAFPETSDYENEQAAVRHAEVLVRDVGSCSKRKNRAIDTHDKACGKLPPFVGYAVIEAMKLLNKKDAGHNIDTSDTLDVLTELSQIWPFAVQGIEAS